MQCEKSEKRSLLSFPKKVEEIRVEIIKTEKYIIEKTNKANWFFEKLTKTDKLLATQIKK